MRVTTVSTGTGRGAQVAAAAMALLWLAGPVAATDTVPGPPLAAIDWLSDSLRDPPAASDGPEPPTTRSATVPGVTVTALEAPDPEAAGLLQPAVTGLPAAPWSATPRAEVEQALARIGTPRLPALQSLLLTLLLAEAPPPAGEGLAGGTFLMTRVDHLLSLGAVDQARALIEQSGQRDAEMMRRLFDIALLTGTEGEVCAALKRTPHVAPSFAARVFCLARGGDWSAAALTLETGQALGHLTPADFELMSRFLHAEEFEDAPPLPRPDRPSPLKFRLMEAIGEPMSSADLPRAFAVADLRDVAGWKAQLMAAERLSRAGALPDNVLLGLYSLRRAAASGGVWDRVAAVQDLTAALRSRDPARVGPALLAARDEMAQARLLVPFARLFGPQLSGLRLRGSPASIAFDIALLSDAYAEAAQDRRIVRPQDGFLIAVATARMHQARPRGALQKAIHAALSDDTVLPAVPEGETGAYLLEAMAILADGGGTPPASVRTGLAGLRRAGQEDSARRAALQLLLTPEPGE